MERGGYPDFSEIYRNAGYSITIVHQMRKAINHIKQDIPDMIVAEFNFQSDFRDRTSSLESLLATLQRYPDVKLIVFYEKEYEHQYKKIRSRFSFHCSLAFPIDTTVLSECVMY